MTTWDIRQGDCRELMADMPDESFTCVLADPPYGLEFMGKGWDHGVPGVAYWAEVLRVLKPGAVLMAFGGTRTHHRLMVAIEDAGLEIFDCMMWLYGSGFPKSHDISKAIDKAAGAERESLGTNPNSIGRTRNMTGGRFIGGHESDRAGADQLTAPATPGAETWQGYGTALKPAWEPIVLARKPRLATYAATAVEHGSGALWIDGGRVGSETITTHSRGANEAYPKRPGEKSVAESDRATPQNEAGLTAHARQGRWPANLLLSHSPGCVRRGERRVKGNGRENKSHVTKDASGYSGAWDVMDRPWSQGDADGFETVPDWDCAPDCAVRLLGEQSGVSRSSGGKGVATMQATARNVYGDYAGDRLGQNAGGLGDTGTAARFFKNFAPPLRFRYSAKSSRGERDSGLSDGERSGHPCVKPLSVTRYLATLLRPPEAYLDDATILIPFAGSGSEMIGALLAGWRNIVGIELEAEYVAIAEARLTWWTKAMALTHKTEPGAILAAMKGRDIDEAVQAELFNGRLP